MQATVTSTKKITIHLVEDDPDDAYLLKRSIEQEAYGLGLSTVVLKSPDGLAALEELSELAAQSQLPDMLIVDLNMPRMDGITFIKNAKANSTLSGIPIVVMTTADDTETLRQAQDEGADSAYTKPLSSMARDALCADVLVRYSKTLQ